MRDYTGLTGAPTTQEGSVVETKEQELSTVGKDVRGHSVKSKAAKEGNRTPVPEKPERSIREDCQASFINGVHMKLPLS